MTQRVRDWLPVGVLERESVRVAANDALELWSKRWFSNAAFVAGGIKAVSGSAPKVDADAEWRASRGSVFVSLSKRARSRLLDLALDVHMTDMTLSDPDRTLLALFEQKLIDDLADSLETLIGLTAPMTAAQHTDPFLGAGGAILGISDQGGGPIGLIAIPFEALLPLCKPEPARRRTTAKLEKISNAAGPTELQVEIILGAVEVGLDELRGLAPGDTLILDKALVDPAALHLAKCDASFASARMVESDGRLTFVL